MWTKFKGEKYKLIYCKAFSRQCCLIKKTTYLNSRLGKCNTSNPPKSQKNNIPVFRGYMDFFDFNFVLPPNSDTKIISICNLIDLE